MVMASGIGKRMFRVDVSKGGIKEDSEK